MAAAFPNVFGLLCTDLPVRDMLVHDRDQHKERVIQELAGDAKEDRDLLTSAGVRE